MSETRMAEKFAKDVEAHEVQVLMDSGVYRHLRVRRSGTYCMGFDIVTYPGYLCYSGDMGTYVFSASGSPTQNSSPNRRVTRCPRTPKSFNQ